MINLAAIARTEVAGEPFQFFATPDVLNAAELAAIETDFPDIRKPGIFPLSALAYGPAFARLIDDIRSQDMADVMAEKYGVDLSDKPLMVTVRGQAQKKDGRIHTDTKTKFVTCLLYLNDTEIATALSRHSDIASPTVLRRYHAKHRRVTRPLYLATNGIVQLYTREDLPARIVRGAMLRLGNRIQPVKHAIVEQLMETRALPD